MMTDPIADMLTRIRNAIRVKGDDVAMPASRTKKAIADLPDSAPFPHLPPTRKIFAIE